MKNITFKIYNNVASLPENWDNVAASNHFLQKPYLKVLENTAPVNMECFFIGIFDSLKLIGVSIAQYINVDHLESFGKRDNCLKTTIRNFIFKNFCSHVLFLGNNMITGENSFVFEKKVPAEIISKILIDCTESLISYFKSKKIKIHIVTYKDFYRAFTKELKEYDFHSMYEFNTQPNMIFKLDKEWQNANDYISALTKKYRDQYKRAHKKIDGVTTTELSLEEIILHEKRIYELYHYVAVNAPFNTFFLSKEHFSFFKKQCGERFKIFGYFKNEELIGFHTILLNEDTLETYFLGYDETHQKEHMLYLNMLYNMTEFGIENHFKKIYFGRTALEIKSSIGAHPIEMSGFIYHTNPLINYLMPKIFSRLEPEVNWQQRHPFK
ncbi:GNAT family N-acetyltransferase [Flavobacterium jejuense]|uniref:GNAT family N-acetyltransferase n=1 Tax=Flavobacterium jejuense TaxID=1544455 RepID=A0ABX0IUN4_9FLAO|nr:GNAT family N-acetyltransferase [Flavobacterium jejuense]NHN26539.1 GNAT family N-acetyltransferase [Flavobacterium jejuense]